MGFYITLFYLAFMIISPATMVPELAAYRVQWWVGGLAVLLTAFMVPVNGYPLMKLQTLQMLGLFFVVPFSRLIRGWMGGAMYAVSEFGSVVVVYFLLVAGSATLGSLRALAIAVTLPAFYACFRGIMATFAGWDPETYILFQNVLDTDAAGHVIFERVRFVGAFADPNDLAQYFLVVTPFVLLLWRKYSPIRNVLLVAPLVLYLFFGMYLTHSRGVVIGLIAVVMVYLRDRFNKTVMAFGAAAVGVLLLAANFAGGRAISFNSGSDRIEAWGAGLTMLRGSPLFGIGYNLFTEHNELTAHNSFVLCFAELGLIGFFLWLGVLVTSVLQLTRLLRRFRGVAGAESLVRWATAVRTSLVGFMVTGWFLSRTYSILIFVLIGMCVMLERIGDRMTAPAAVPGRRAVAPPPSSLWHWAPATATLQVACLLLVYAMVRARWSN